MLLDPTKSSFLMIDIQERLLPAMINSDRVLQQNGILLQTAAELNLPVAMSEQYPKGLGHTVQDLYSNSAKMFEKLSFSCWRDEAIRSHLIGLHDAGRPQIILSGIEAHVCVLQTATDLSHAGFATYVVADAVSSRTSESITLAFNRMRDCGVQIVNTEMVIFELLQKAGTPQFKLLSALIK